MMSWLQKLKIWGISRHGQARPERAKRTWATRGLMPGIEGLEKREVLSAAAVAPIFSVNGQITTAGQPTTVNFQLGTGTLTAPKGASTVLIGIDPTPAAGATLTPMVTAVSRGDGASSVATKGSMGEPFLTRVSVPSNGSVDYTASVRAPAGETGAFTLKIFLAGDVNGDLQVDKNDLDRILAAYGSKRGDPQYDAAADINQDGVVGCLDRTYTVENLGAKFTPTLEAATVSAPVTTPIVSPQVTTTTAASTTSTVAVTPSVTVAPVPVTTSTAAVPTVAIAAVSPVTPIAVATPTVVVPTVAAPSANVVWIPVILTSGESAAQAVSLEGLTSSSQLSGYYPTTYGTTVASSTVAPTYYTTPATATPSGPSYFVLSNAGSQQATTTQTPVYFSTSTRPVSG